MKLPRYKVTVLENSEEFQLEFLSLVEDPAIMVKALAFAKEKRLYLSEDDKQIIAGPALIPDLPIYRRDKDTGYEYEIVFTKEDIEMIVEMFNKNNKEHKINLEHTETLVKSAFIKGNWITSNPDKSQAYGFDLPAGSWFVETKVEDKEEWLKLKQGEHTSYSIEGVFKLIQLNLNKQTQTNNLKLMKAKLKDGTEINISTETLEVGATVTIMDAEGNELPAPAGEHTLESGEVIVTDEAGVITEVKTVEMADDKKDEKKDEVKMEVTEDDINMIWSVFEPKITEMVTNLISALEMSKETVEKTNTELAEVKAELEKTKTELSNQVVELTARLDNKPAGKSVTKLKADEKPINDKDKFKLALERVREYADKTANK